MSPARIPGRAGRRRQSGHHRHGCRHPASGPARQYRRRRQFRGFRRSAIRARSPRHRDCRGHRRRGQQRRRTSWELHPQRACCCSRPAGRRASTPMPPNAILYSRPRARCRSSSAHAQIVNLSLAGPADPLLNGLIREGVRRVACCSVGAASDGDASEGVHGLLRQPGVIEVASSEESVRILIAGVRAGSGDTDAIARRTLRLRIGSIHRDGAGGAEWSPCLLAKDPALSAKRRAAVAARHQPASGRRRGHAGGRLRGRDLRSSAEERAPRRSMRRRPDAARRRCTVPRAR